MSTIPAKRRALLLSAASAGLVMSCAVVAGPASAANECGAPSGGTVTCTSAGNPYATGITYSTTSPLVVTTNPDVAATGPILVSGSGADVGVNNNGAVNTTTASTTGGVGAVASGGSATIVNTGGVTTNAASTPGLFGEATGNVSITNSANVSAQGAGSDAIDAFSVNGASSVTITGGAVTGARNGVGLISAIGSTSTLTNAGTITGGTDFAVATAGGPAQIFNNGTINGAIGLGGSGNLVSNSGTWNATGTSSFGPSGTNLLDNTGTITVAQGVTAPTTVTFTGLSALNNAGTIDLRYGNSLNIGTVLNGQTGSTVDVLGNGGLGGNPTSVLTVVGSTGATTIVPTDIVSGTPGYLNFTGQTLVTGASPGTFSMPGGGADFHRGFIDFRLGFNPTGGVYTLYNLPGREVFEALNIPYAAQDFWRHSADVWTQRVMDIRDSLVGSTPSRAEGWEIWMLPYGGHDSFERGQVFTFAANPSFVFNRVGINSADFGLQLGADVVSHLDNGYGYWGFTGGLQQQETNFIGDNQNDLYLLGGNFGMYGGINWGGLYLNGLGKVDFIDLNANFNSAAFSPSPTWMTWGGKLELGYRYPFGGFFVEPAARVSGIWTDTKDLTPPGALIAFHTDDPITFGEFGGRVGTTLGFFGVQFNGYAGAFYADQLSGHNGMSFTTGPVAAPTTIGLVQAQTGSFIRVEYGVESGSIFGFKGFLKGENDVEGDGVGAWGAQMGVRFSY